ncbi:hypothetical protein SCUP234_04922 [Seiridium cupressi]|uniref:HTH CENPB-type domain-containing protein n=1 Tax=Seiridium unicorne TaxID=138068 RepID=A0ABR2V5X5_9PEZI
MDPNLDPSLDPSLNDNMDPNINNNMDPGLDASSLQNLQVPVDLPSYEPRQLTGSRRAGIRYKAYTAEDFERAMQAVREQGMSLRKASATYNVPKTTLAEKLGDNCPNLPPLQATRKNKIATRYTWTEADMEQAVAAVAAGTHASEAARQFGVPYSNLNSRTRGRPPRDLKADLARLTLKQENLLVDWARAQCELGFPPSKDQIYDLASKVLEKGGTGQKLGKQWVGHWLRRHPQITALDWAPKSKWEKKQPKNFEPNVYTSASFADQSFVPDTSNMEGEPAGGVISDNNHGADLISSDSGLGEVASLMIQT